MVSTDKAVNPTNVMGCSKRICEIYVQSLDRAIKEGKVQGVTQFVTTRFGNVLGSNGSVIPLFRQQIKNGGPVTVTHPNIFRYFMLIPEACKLVLEAGTMGKGGEIFVFDMGAPVKIADLAQRMIKLSGAQNVKIVYTGLRDGEKLYEEVLNDKEVTKPTFNEKIKIAQVREYDFEEVKHNINDLIAHSFQYDVMNTVKEMKTIVPEFKSNHSVYEQLDKN
jgi:FlaA1/EpsC-like NDP-sugar epimerase